MKTLNAVLNDIFQRGDLDLMFAKEYAEPGYTDPEKGILFANWNDEPLKRIGDLAEKAGYAIEWGDEWCICDGCGKAVRTSPDSYGWRRSYFENDGEIVCIDCVREDPTDYLASLEGDPRRAETMDLDLTAHGYVLAGDDYAHGWHPGQNDSPDVIAKSLQARGIHRFIFKIDDVGQFDVHFSVYVHEDEMALLQDAPVASKLPYDPGTEMAKALRGEPSDVYTMTTKQISQAAMRACPKLSFDPHHYNEDGTACKCPKKDQS